MHDLTVRHCTVLYYSAALTTVRCSSRKPTKLSESPARDRKVLTHMIRRCGFTVGRAQQRWSYRLRLPRGLFLAVQTKWRQSQRKNHPSHELFHPGQRPSVLKCSTGTMNCRSRTNKLEETQHPRGANQNETADTTRVAKTRVRFPPDAFGFLFGVSKDLISVPGSTRT